MLLVLGWYLLRPNEDNSGLDTDYNAICTDESSRDQESSLDKKEGKIERIEPTVKKLAKNIIEADTPQPSEIKLIGTITVLDESGIEHTSENGRIDFVLWMGTGGLHRMVTVTNGRWSATIPPDVELGVDDIRLGGRVAIMEGEKRINDKRFPIPPTGFLALTAQWPPIPVLHFIAADTGEELDSVELHEVAGLCYDKNPNNVRKVKICTNARSPIDMAEIIKDTDELNWGIKVYFARSPGYCWKRVEVDFRRGCEYFLKLYPCGDLEVVITGYQEGTRPGLSIWNIGEYETYRSFDIRKDGPISVESIPVGTYLVCAELGEMSINSYIMEEDSIILGKGEVDVLAGQTSSIILSLRAPPEVVKVPLKGTLVIPPAWEYDRVTMKAEILNVPVYDGLTAINFSNRESSPTHVRIGPSIRHYLIEYLPLEQKKDNENVYSWNAGSVQPGLYEFSVKPMAYVTRRKVGPEGLTDAVITVAPPARVAIRVVDDMTGVEIKVDSLYWQFRPPEPFVNCTTGGKAKVNEKTGLFEFEAPLGQIGIEISSDYYYIPGLSGHTLTVHPGNNGHTIRVFKCCGFDLILRDGNVTLPYNIDWFLEPIKADEEEFAICWSCPHVEGRRFRIEGPPGLYRFKMPNIEGYLQVPEQEVLVKSGEYTRHVIQLQRER